MAAEIPARIYGKDGEVEAKSMREAARVSVCDLDTHTNHAIGSTSVAKKTNMQHEQT